MFLKTDKYNIYRYYVSSYQLMCKCWSFDPLERPSFAYLLQQLQKFHETCQSVSEYLLPISSNRTFAQGSEVPYLIEFKHIYLSSIASKALAILKQS